MFLPGTTSLVAQTGQSDLLLIDTLGEREGTSGPAQVGAADAIVGFVPTTKTLITATAGTRTSTDLGAAEHPSSAFPSVAGDSQVCVAPNGLHAAITTGTQQIVYVDLADGRQPGTVAGQAPNWCSVV